MAITVDAVSSANGTTATTLSWTHVVGSGTDTVLVVGVGIRKESDPRPTVTGVTWNGVALTQIGTEPNAQKTSSDLWIKVNPATGSHSVEVTYSSAPENNCAGAISFFGVDQTTPTEAFAGAAGESATATITASTASGNLFVDCVAAVDTLTVGSGQTSRWSQSNSFLRAASSTEAGGTSVVMSWTLGGIQRWTTVVCALRNSPNATGTITGKSITVVGGTVTATAGQSATGTITGKAITVVGGTVFATTGQSATTIIVTGGGVHATPELWLATIGNSRHTNISDLIIDGFVELNVDRAVKLQLQVKVRDADQFTPYTDYLAPFIRYEYEDGRETTRQKLGLYAFTLPPGEYTTTRAEATLTGNDLTSVAFGYYPVTPVNIPATTNVGSQINTRLIEAGLILVSIPDCDETFDRLFGTNIEVNYGEMINGWLNSIGWSTLHMGLDAYVTTLGAYRTPGQQEPFATYVDTDMMSTFVPNRSEEQVYNVGIAIRDDATLPPLRGTFTNDDAASPSSTVNIGRRVAPPIKVPRPTSQARLNAIAKEAVTRGRSFYQTATFSVLPDVNAFIPGQTVYLDFDANGKMEPFRGLWAVRSARMGLTPDAALLTMEVSQTKKYDGTEL